MRTDPTPTISVVICSYTTERWAELQAACASVTGELTADDEVLVVIDHNDPLLAMARYLPGVRVMANTGTPGLSGARNTGIAASHGEVVGFLDDDATARPGWLAALRDLFSDQRITVAGTEVRPRWHGGTAPAWFPEEFGWVVGCGYRGLPRQRTGVRNPIGAAMAIRREAFATGGFSERVGRVGTLPTGCEETEFCIRLARRHPAVKIVHEPTAIVDHLVPAARQTLRYFLRRCFHEGRSKRAVAALGGHRAGLSAERRYVRSVLPLGVLREAGSGLVTLRVHRIARAGAILLGLGATTAGFVLANATGRGGYSGALTTFAAARGGRS